MTLFPNRREFLERCLAGGGLLLAFSLFPFECRVVSAQTLRKGRPEVFLPSVWIQITSDNIVTVIVNKSEMGQGIATALAMIVAEELDADWSRVRFEIAPGREKYKDPVWGAQATGRSTSVRNMIEPLRKGAAAAREMLVQVAAGMWNISENHCEAFRGTVRQLNGNRSLTFGELCALASKFPAPPNPRLKKDGPLRIIGTAVQRLDIPPKVDSTAIFGVDVFVQNLLYATIVRPKAFGAKAVSFDRSAVESIPGVRKVVAVDSGVAVCSESALAAWAGRNALNVKWSRGAHPALSSRSLQKSYLRRLIDIGVTVRSEGDCRAALGNAAKKVRATYFLPYLAHATMEPMNCTAHVRKNACDIWVPTQNQTEAIATAARESGLDVEAINVYTTYLGGGFGRRLETDYVRDAVQVSRVTGTPIKLMWTREEDMQNGFYRPAACCRLDGGLDSRGRLIAWSHKIVSPSLWARVAPEKMTGGVDASAVDGIVNTVYDLPNLHVEYIRIDTPVPVGFWRSEGNTHNAFAVESFMDELAFEAGKDPLEFRLGMLKDNPRAHDVLNFVAEKAGWGKPPAAGRGRGIAQHFTFGSYVAQVAEVSVDEKKGHVKVHKVVCAVDCGYVVNPDTIAAQMEGGIIFGLSAALKEKVEVANGGVVSSNFSDYRILTMSEVPEIEVHIIKTEGKPGGISDVAVPPVAPALANAVFAATGARVRHLPMSGDALLGALRRARKRGGAEPPVTP
ncbi:MAG: xanthine dehydrogenase family protein molybdopterin-binding subunit [Syntrophobacteraceae bacterium]|nr:xanthine dehydrogenase family protein molybdopterin-binding subunit [Desulfobacteraceae bacterium]